MMLGTSIISLSNCFPNLIICDKKQFFKNPPRVNIDYRKSIILSGSVLIYQRD